MLSGHTHGGQFNLFGLNPYSIGFERFGDELPPPAVVSGMMRFGPTTLLTSKGIGVSRIPLRIGVRPEIHLLTFSA
jgi:predicted MPP superfamily phosphohydrolase